MGLARLVGRWVVRILTEMDCWTFEFIRNCPNKIYGSLISKIHLRCAWRISKKFTYRFSKNYFKMLSGFMIYIFDKLCFPSAHYESWSSRDGLEIVVLFYKIYETTNQIKIHKTRVNFSTTTFFAENKDQETMQYMVNKFRNLTTTRDITN